MDVGVIGLGNIGVGLATNLVADGHDVVVFDTDAERAASITGARVALDGDIHQATSLQPLDAQTVGVNRHHVPAVLQQQRPASKVFDL